MIKRIVKTVSIKKLGIKKLLLLCWGVFIVIGLFKPLGSEVSAEDSERIMTMAPFLIAGVVILVITIIVVAHVRYKGPEPIPSHPASAGYNIGVKLFSTVVFFVVLALCIFGVREQLQSNSWMPSTPGKSTTSYVRTYLWGMELGTVTSKGSSSQVPEVSAAAPLGILLFCTVGMLLRCVDDWRRTFGVPDKKRLRWTILLGFTGCLQFMRGNRSGGLIRLGFSLLGCIFCVSALFFNVPLFAYGLLIIVYIWSREIIYASNGGS